MQVKKKPQHDPVSDLAMADVYMRWALLAAEEVVGKQGLAVVLRQVGLERLIDHYPANDTRPTSGLTCGEYASFFGGLLDFYGRAGKAMLLRIGRLSSKHAIEEQAALFGINVATMTAIKLLPATMQIKVGLENTQAGFRKLWQSYGQDLNLRLEDRGDQLAYIAEDCPMCAGKQADAAMCISFTGSLQENIHWLTGKDFEVTETECRALGAPACVWEIAKTPTA